MEIKREVLISIENLNISFGHAAQQVQAVQDLSFQIRNGETVSLVGESGSGKSLTAMSIVRLLPVTAKVTDSSHIFWHEMGEKTDLMTLTSRRMRQYRGKRIGMIFQEPMTALNPVHRCGHQISEALEIHEGLSRKAAKSKVLSLLEQVQLPDPERIYRAYPHELSGGQKQRIVIAMAISCEPALLIADEPTTALDVSVQQDILQLLRELQRVHQMAILFISHDLSVVASMADRILVMKDGRLLEAQPTAQLLQQPQHPYTKGLLACRPPLGQQLSRLPVISDFDNPEVQISEVLAQYRTSEAAMDARQRKLASQPIVLQVDNVSVWFPMKKNLWGCPLTHLKAVNEASLYVRAGETLGLVGESGCGKTTLGRAIIRLIDAQGGEVTFKGQSLWQSNTRMLRSMRKHIQMIFQDPYASLNPRMTIGRAIVEPMRVHRLYGSAQQRKEKAISLLESVGLSATYFDRYPHQFSGGQRQRVCIARALAVNPSFLICDESVSALDVSVQAQVLNLLVSLRKQFDFGCLFISHDLAVIRFISDRIAVMHQGKIVEEGLPQEIFENPQTAYTRRLINAIPQDFQ